MDNQGLYALLLEEAAWILCENCWLGVLTTFSEMQLAGRWNDAVKMRMTMKDIGLKRMPGCSWIELNKVHAFLVGDRSDTQSQKIYATLMSLCLHMEEAGYIPGTSFAMHDVEEEEKEYILCGHGEKLA